MAPYLLGMMCVALVGGKMGWLGNGKERVKLSHVGLTRSHLSNFSIIVNQYIKHGQELLQNNHHLKENVDT